MYFRPLGSGKPGGGTSGIRAPPASRPAPIVRAAPPPPITRPPVTSKFI